MIATMIDSMTHATLINHTPNESLPTTITNDTINLFFKTAIGILAISNDNSFACCLIKLLLYILFEKYIYI